MSYYNKDDEHKYRFVIWVAVCCAVFLLITTLVVICSIYVFNKKHVDDSANKEANSKALESMFSSITPSSSEESKSSEAVPSQESVTSSAASTASTASSSGSSGPLTGSSQAPSSVTPAENAYIKNYDPAFLTVNLPVECILQIPDLPQGCEVTSLAIAMKYKGYGTDIDNLKCYLADNFLPKAASNAYDKASEFFLGNPRFGYPDGLYCFEGAILKTLAAYNESRQNDQVLYSDITGIPTEELYSGIESDIPVILWVTTDWKDPDYNGSYYQNLHCVVLTGYSDNVVQIADPLQGIVYVARDRFEYVWEAMGRRAIAIDNF